MRQKVSSYEEKKRFILYKGHTGWKIKTRIFGSLLVTFSAFAIAGNSNIISVHAATDTAQQEENSVPALKNEPTVQKQSSTATTESPDNSAKLSSDKETVGTVVADSGTGDKAVPVAPAPTPATAKGSTSGSTEEVQNDVQASSTDKESGIVTGNIAVGNKDEIGATTEVTTKASLLRDTTADDSVVTNGKEYPVLSQSSSTNIGADDKTEVELSGDQIKNHFKATVENKNDSDKDYDPTDNTYTETIGDYGSIELTSNDAHYYQSYKGDTSNSMHGHQVAHVSFEHEIDFSHNFNMTGALGIGSRTGNQAADSVGFIFAPGNPTTATKGGSGGELGLGGLSDAFGFVYDQWYNGDQNDPSRSPYFGWRTTDGNGNLQRVRSSSEWANASSNDIHLNDRTVNSLNDFTMNYDATSKVLSVTLGSDKSSKGRTFSRNITDTDTGYSISVAASTGGSWNDYSAKIDTFSYTPKTIDLGVNLVDDVKNNTLLDGAAVKAQANIGDTISVFSTQDAANRAVKAKLVDPNLVAVIPTDKAGNVYVVDGDSVISNNNSQAHYIDGQNDGVVGNTYYSYTVTDGSGQLMNIPVKKAFTAEVTPVDKIGNKIPNLSPVTVVAVEGEPTLVQIPGYTTAKITLATPEEGESTAHDTLTIDMDKTGTDSTTTDNAANPIGHSYKGTGLTVDGKEVNSSATVGTGQSISDALDGQKFTVDSGGKTPITSSDYYWSNSGNASATDSTDSQESSSWLLPTGSTLQYWEGQATTNQKTAEEYKQQSQNMYDQFVRIANLTETQKNSADSLLATVKNFYKEVSDTNGLAQTSFKDGETNTIAKSIYQDGQEGYKDLMAVKNLLVEFKANLDNLTSVSTAAQNSLATFKSWTISYGDQIGFPPDISVGKDFGDITSDQKVGFDDSDYFMYYSFNGSTEAVIPENVGDYIVKLTDEGREYLKSISSNKDAGLYVSPTLTIKPKSTSVQANGTSIIYGDSPQFSSTVDNDKLSQTDYEVTNIATGNVVTGKDLHNGFILSAGDYSVDYTDEAKATLSGDKNYSIEEDGYKAGTFTVKPKEITVKAIQGSKEYGTENDPKLSLSAEGLVNNDGVSNLGIKLIRSKGEDAGNYQINADLTKLNPNYSVKTFTPGNFIISKKPITVSVAKPVSITYGEQPKLSVDAVYRDGEKVDLSEAGLTLNDFSVLGQTFDLTNLNANSDGYTIQLNDSGKDKLSEKYTNYVVDDDIGTNTLVVNKKSIDLKINGDVVIYGNTPSLNLDTDSDVTLNGASKLQLSDFILNNGDEGSDFNKLDVGSHDLGLNPTSLTTLESENPNYDFKSISGSLLVAKRPVLVSIVNSSKSTYGIEPKPQITVTDNATGNLVKLNNTNTTAGDFTIAGKDKTDFSVLDIGSYKIDLTKDKLDVLENNNPNYEITSAVGNLTIDKSKAEISITATSKYGTTPIFSVTGKTTDGHDIDVKDVVLDTKDFVVNGQQSTDFSNLNYGVHDLELTQEGLEVLNAAKPNYDFTTSSGALKVDKAQDTVLITANKDNTSIYGSKPKFTITSADGKKGLDDLSGLELSDDDFVVKQQTSTDFSKLNKGVYEIELTQKGLQDLDAAKLNYDFTSSSGSLKVIPAHLNLQIDMNNNDDTTFVYGTNPELHISATDSNGQKVVLKEDSLDFSNFTVVNQNKTDFNKLNVGKYDVVLTNSSLNDLRMANSNYEFSMPSKNLAVTAASAKVQINVNADNSSIYGTVPAFNVVATDINGDSINIVNAKLNEGDFTVSGQQATDFSKLNVNKYSLVLTEQGKSDLHAANSNYDFTSSSGSLNVIQSPTTVKINVNKENSSVYGTKPEFNIVATDSNGKSVNLDGINLEDDEFQIKDKPSLEFNNLNVGNYDLVLTEKGIADLNAARPNYKFVSSTGNIDITKAKAMVTITANRDDSSVYGTHPEFTLSATDIAQSNSIKLNDAKLTEDEFLANDDASTDFSKLNVGGYNIKLTNQGLIDLGFANPNYEFISSTGKLKINKAQATVQVTANKNNSSIYGTTPEFTIASIDNPINFNDLKLGADKFTVRNQTSTDFSKLNKGDYEIEVTQQGLKDLDAANPNYNFTSSSGSLKVTPAHLNLQIDTNNNDDTTFVYGTNPELHISATDNDGQKVVLKEYNLDFNNFTVVNQNKTDFNKLNVGKYDIVLTDSSLNDLRMANSNYEFSMPNKNLAVTAVSAKVQINVNTDNSSIYGTAPAFNVVATDINGDSINIGNIKLGEGDFTVSGQQSTDFSKLNVNKYSLVLTEQGKSDLHAANPNYYFTESAGNLLIKKAIIRVNVVNTPKVKYSKKIVEKSLDIAVSLGTRGDTLVGKPDLDDYQIIDSQSKKIVEISNLKAGEYIIQLKPDSLQKWQAENPNYDFRDVSGILTVEKANVNANVSVGSITYGDNDLKISEDTTDDDSKLHVELNKPLDLDNDDYEVVDQNDVPMHLNELQAGGAYYVKLKDTSLMRLNAENPDYKLSSKPVRLNVGKRKIEINVTSQNKYTSETNPTNSSTIKTGSLRDGDSLASLGINYSEPNDSVVGTYVINADATNPNYDVKVIPAKLVVLGKTVDKDGNTTTTQKDENGKVVNVNKSWSDGTQTDYKFDPKTGIQSFTESLNGKPVVTKTVNAIPEEIDLPDGNGAITVVKVTADTPETPEIVHYGIDPDKDGRTSADEIMKYHTDPLVPNHSGGMATPSVTVIKKNQNVATTTEMVPLFDKNGKQIMDRNLDIDSCWFSDEEYTVGGTMYYRVATDEFAKASDVYVYIEPEPVLVRVYNNLFGNLVDYQGTKISRELSPSSEWKADRIALINGQQYYRVATNEFVPVGEVYKYSNVNTEVTTKSETSVYNERGEKLNIALPANGTYKADKVVLMNGVKFYRVATNQFVPAALVRDYAEVDLTVTTNANTPMYDQQGNLLRAYLPNNASYKVDRISFINGAQYYRVATNMYIKVRNANFGL